MRAWFGESDPLPAPTPSEVIDALEDARQILGCQRDLAKRAAFDWVNGRPCFCIVAAITIASRTKQIRDAAMDCTRRALPWRVHSIEDYNDFAATTVEDAKTLLQRAKSNAGSVAA